MSVQFSATTEAFALILVLISVYRWASKRTHLPLPPGPKGWPLLGNLLDIPTANIVETYTNWARKYGQIVYADAAGQSLILLNDTEVANEMLYKKGATYSDRPVFNMSGELAGFGQWTAHLMYGPRLKESRKYMYRTIGTRESLEKHGTLFNSEARKLLKAALRDPDNIHQHVRRFAGAIIVRITYGYEAQEQRDPIITLAESTVARFSQFVQPGAYLVDKIPILKYVPAWFPGAGFKNEASEAKRYLMNLVDIPFQFILHETAKGTAPSCFVTENIMTEVDQENLKWTASSLFAGGADTTVSVLSTFYLVMTLFPDVQRKAQEEIDRIVGNARLPELVDRDNLPYVNALHSEIYRWRPVVPLGVPHKTTTADTHRGYHIPKGSIIIPNIWQMLHDPVVYSEPELFSPERFLETSDSPAEPNPRACFFGFGRRICPGSQFADATVWLAITTALAVFHVSKVVEEGVEVTPEVRYTDTFISHPVEFKCSIKPRSARAKALILQS
ncbi:cytochrome P450 [Russula earlei]|uniref:Cytochrome P450 n=1 Tax=Russula earlei TaxID=71964 RepID=A0ACC0TXY3_9AGAM|nr:cytochrome P450 [Russula earlei]